MFGLNKTAILFSVVGIILVSACSPSAGGDRSSNAHTPNLKRSFPLRQGHLSAVTCLAADNRGHIYAAGFSDRNLVLLKMDAELKTLIKMVRFGSTNDTDYIKDMAIDSRGNIFVVGYTGNPNDFPVTKGAYRNPMYRNRGAVSSQGFVTKFSPDLKLLASTSVGGDYSDKFYAIAIDRHDNIYAAGFSNGSNPSTYHKAPRAFVPPAGAYDRKPAPGNQTKALVVKLSNDLSTLKAATLLGGNQKKYNSDNIAYDLAIDHGGHIWITGTTQSVDFPVTKGCLGRGLSGENDAFVSKFDPDLKTLLASTYLGGRKKELANAILTDKKGRVFVGGWSESADMLASLKGFDTKHSRNEEDVFIVKLDPHLKKIEAGTFLGGDMPHKIKVKGENGKKDKEKKIQGDDILACMLLSDDGKTLYVAGRTESKDFDTTPPSRVTHSGNMVLNLTLKRRYAEENHRGDSDYGDGFIARFDTNLTKRISSTLFGGTSLEYVNAMLIQDQNFYLAGETHSTDFPGMTINYTITASRGFISCFDKDVSRKFPSKKPMAFKPQLSDAKIKKIANSYVEDIKKRLGKNDMYAMLGRYGKKHISRKDFEAKIQRAIYLYGKPFVLGIKFHHYNYFQDFKDGYDLIELCYVERVMSHSYRMNRHTTLYSNPNGGRIVLKILVKNKKWQLADIEYRGFSTEGSNMVRRMYYKGWHNQ